MTGVNLNAGRAGRRGRDLGLVGIDEQGHPDTGGFQAGAAFLHLCRLTLGIQAALGGELGPFFRHQAAKCGFNRLRDGQHLIGNGHFQVHRRAHGFPQEPHVPIPDMTPIFPEMHRDRVRAGLFGQVSRGHRVGIGCAARLSYGRDMIDVDAEQHDKECE